MRESKIKLTLEDSVAGTRMALLRFNSRDVRVHLPDTSCIHVHIDRKAKGAELLDKVCDELDLLEKDYFGLLYEDRGDPRCWIDLDKRISKIFRNEPWEVTFAVKFYPPEPSELQEDVTRYQLALCIRQDLLEGRLSCSSITYALLASYQLQGELGDFEPRLMEGEVLAQRSVAPPSVLTPQLEDKILELYKTHKGQTPAETELNYLENVKKLPMYGMDLHAAKDSEDVDISLGVCYNGISIYRDCMLMNRFPWTKILKISYKKRVYTLKLRASEFDEFESHVSFKLPATRACKKLWKASVEHHMFFRRPAPVAVARVASFPRLGSRRLSCRRTLQQLRADGLSRPPQELIRPTMAVV